MFNYSSPDRNLIMAPIKASTITTIRTNPKIASGANATIAEVIRYSLQLCNNIGTKINTEILDNFLKFVFIFSFF